MRSREKGRPNSEEASVTLLSDSYLSNGHREECTCISGICIRGQTVYFITWLMMEPYPPFWGFGGGVWLANKAPVITSFRQAFMMLWRLAGNCRWAGYTHAHTHTYALPLAQDMLCNGLGWVCVPLWYLLIGFWARICGSSVDGSDMCWESDNLVFRWGLDPWEARFSLTQVFSVFPASRVSARPQNWIERACHGNNPKLMK